MSSVDAIADTVAMLHAGVIQWTGPKKTLKKSGDPFVNQFIGGSANGPIETLR
jgi:phospholipid/cholesterol/gamma-HCH transport system ATP-binding protein